MIKVFDAIYWNVDPEIITLFGVFPLKYYGLLFITGLIISFQIIKYIFKKENQSLDKLEQLTTYLVIGIFIGMRLGHCFFYDWDYYADHILEIFIPFKEIDGSWKFTGFAGLASHGGSIGAIIAVILFSKKHRISFWWLLDRIGIVAPLTGAFIRLGNFMNSEIYGKPTNSEYGVIFAQDDIIPRHPTQLYEAAGYFLIFGLLWYLYQKTSLPKKEGVLLGILLTVLFTLRFFLEFFKENQVAFEDSMALNMGQWLSIPFAGVGLLLILLKYSNHIHLKPKH